MDLKQARNVGFETKIPLKAELLFHYKQNNKAEKLQTNFSALSES